MAQPPEAAVDAPVVSEDADVLAALDEFIDGPGDAPATDDTEPADEPEGGDEPDAEEPEDDEDEADEPETAIDPPASLTAEEKAAWAQLPPEAQLMLKTVEARRTTEVQKGLEKARDAQQEAQRAAAERVAQAQKLFAEQQAAIAQRYAPQPPDARRFPDWQSFSAADAEYKAALAQHENLLQQVRGLHEEAVAEEQRLESVSMQRMVSAVKDEVPELTNGEFQALMDKLTPLALELGYPEDLLAEASPIDIRAIKRAAEWKADSDKYKALMARQMTKVRSAKTAKPNAAQPLGSGKARASATAAQRLRKSGSLEDAAEALAHLI